MDCLTLSYDTVNAVISVADLITDVLVTYRFYHQKRTFFFILAVGIIFITHICYSICFAVRFTRSTWRCKRILVFLLVLPISPLLPFLFYYASFPNNAFSKFLQYAGLEPDEVDLNDYRNASNQRVHLQLNQQPLLQSSNASISYSSVQIREIKKASRKAKYQRMNAWFQTRILFNCGFLIEGVMQSFPQAILQCIAMMHYGEDDNYLAVTSIILSLLSIAIKSIVMFLDSYCTIYVVHKWIACMADFLGIFVTISLAFSHIDMGEQDEQSQCIWLCHWIYIDGISWLGYLWFYKVLFITLPLVFLLVLGLILFYVHSFYEENNCLKLNLLFQCCSFFPSLLIFAILWIPGSIALVIGVVGFEVCSYCWFLWLFYQWNHDRFPTDYSYPDTWNLLFRFLLNNDKYDVHFQRLLVKHNKTTKINDIEILKLYSVNYVLSDTKSYYNDQRNDEPLFEYLSGKELNVFGCHKCDKISSLHDMNVITLKDFWKNSGKYSAKKECLLRSFASDLCSIYPELLEKICQTGRYTEVYCYIGFPALFIFTFTVWVFAPLYFVLNRLLSFLYPFMALLWLLYPKQGWFQYDFSQPLQTQNLTVFQYCITAVFIVFDLICLYLTIKLISFERVLAYILPGNDYINIYSRRNSDVSVYDQVIDFYEFHKYNILTNNYLITTYGDIAYIIISYLPQSFAEYQLLKHHKFKPDEEEKERESTEHLHRESTSHSIENSLSLYRSGLL